MTQPETFHACPPDGSGLTPCCGRTPFELPLGDRISSETVTCTEPAPASLRDQYATAIHADLNAHKGRLDQGLLGIVPRLTDAVLAVRDTEMQQLRARVAELEQALADADTTQLHTDGACEAVQRAETAEAARDRVRALHQPTPGVGFGPDDDPTPGAYGDIAQACTSCGTADEFAVRWPCPTIRALGGPARPGPQS
ncbi:hypothetical protein AB0B42_00545 [Streptomyces fradiae]|uniref:hypothetical protein n=1 Tax=Streptomyces fradiae TaxID=1906 RepID=UPI0033E961C6